jgi:DNA-binding MarR family transcriptional regulator
MQILPPLALGCVATCDMKESRVNRNESLGYLISHLNVALQNTLDQRLKRYGLDIKLWPVLFALWQEEGITQTELSKRCDVANYTMTRLLDQLQSQGLISRHQEADNRRAFQIFLTDDAKALEQDLICEAERVNAMFLANIDREEQALLMSLLNKINRFDD